MPGYRMVYGDEEQVTREVFDDVELEREDGWTVVFRGNDAILRVRDEHVQSLELLDDTARADGGSSAAGGPTVADLMRPAVMTVERTAHLAAATYLMHKAGDTALVVIDDVAQPVPVAVITEADIVQTVADGKDPNEVRISDLVGRTPVTVSPETGVAEAADRMLSSHIRHLPVVDGGRLVGMVDIADACRGLLTMQRS